MRLGPLDTGLAVNLVFTGGAIGNYPASHPEIPFPPEPDDIRLYGAGSSSERRVTYSSSDATTHTNATVVQRALAPAARAAELAQPGQRISSSATFVA
jgi:hypothetical protein